MEAAVFTMRNFFAEEDDSDDEAAGQTSEQERFCTRDHEFPGLVLTIREFDFHPVNANLVWPGASSFASWIMERPHLFKHRFILELGSGTGALAIFLQRQLGCDITTSDYDDAEIEQNIAHNCELNAIASRLPHIRHTWGDPFPVENPRWDLIIASDILLYVKQYAKLVTSLKFLLSASPAMLETRGRGGSESGVKNTEQEEEVCTLSSSNDAQQAAGCDGHEGVGSEAETCTAAAEGVPQHHQGVVEVELHPTCALSDAVACDDIEPCGTASGHDSPNSMSTSACHGDRLGGEERVRVQSHSDPLSLPVPCFLMSWRRRIPKADEEVFFSLCRDAGLVVEDYGQRIFAIHP